MTKEQRIEQIKSQLKGTYNPDKEWYQVKLTKLKYVQTTAGTQVPQWRCIFFTPEGESKTASFYVSEIEDLNIDLKSKMIIFMHAVYYEKPFIIKNGIKAGEEATAGVFNEIDEIIIADKQEPIENTVI